MEQSFTSNKHQRVKWNLVCDTSHPAMGGQHVDILWSSAQIKSWNKIMKYVIKKRWCDLHAIWSYNERWDFPRAGSSLFLPRFSGLTFLRFLGPFFIFSEIFASGVLYFLRWFFIFFQLLNEMKGTYMNNKKNLAALDLYVFFDSNTF